VTATERDALVRDGAIEPLGESGRIWRMRPNWAIRGFSARYGEALASLPRGNALRCLLVSEITKRPMEATS